MIILYSETLTKWHRQHYELGGCGAGVGWKMKYSLTNHYVAKVVFQKTLAKSYWDVIAIIDGLLEKLWKL